MDLYKMFMKQAVKVKRLLKGYSEQTSYSAYLDKIQFKSPEELRELQAVSICELLNHAVNHIPYYKELNGKFKLTPESVFSDILQFPIMTKDILIENKDQLIADNIEGLKELETSGTSGREAHVIIDRESLKRSPDEFFNKKVGMVPGKSRLILKSNENTNAANKIGGLDYDFNEIAKTYRINHHYMNDRKFNFLINTIRKKKPKIIWGNTHGAFVIANYIEMHSVDIPKPELIIVGGQQLLPQYRKKIEKVFETNAYDRYGSVECGVTAHQCLEKDGYHYVPTVHYIEILDKDLNPVQEGEVGDLYITTLSKRAMPMIRYDHEDRAEFTSGLCPCGCNFPIIAKIHGRRKEGIVSPSGTYLSLVPASLIINQSNVITDYQMIQIKNDSLLLRVVCDGNLDEDPMIAKIKSDIRSHMNYDMKINFETMDYLKPLPNGKVRRIIPLSLLHEMGDQI